MTIEEFRKQVEDVAAEAAAAKGRVSAEVLTLQFAQSGRKLDGGKEPISESPLFGGSRQKEMF